MYVGYAYGNTTELWSNRRVLDYLHGDPATGTLPLRQSTQFVSRLSDCANYLPLTCDPPGVSGRYISPALDDAPWYDPTIPESAEFAGLYVEEVTGFDATVSRDVTEGALFGGALGPLRLGPRNMTVTGYLFAATCCAASYGLSWLTEALVDSSCQSCAISDFIMMKCCPPDSDLAPEAIDYVRSMQRVGLVDGPKVVDKFGRCCENCGYTTLKVQFTLTAEIPYLFSDVIYSAYDATFGETEEDLGWFHCNDCEPVDTGDFDPRCGPASFDPPEPFSVGGACYCDPWCSRHLCASFTNDAQWNQVSTIFEVAAGSADIYNLKITAWDNPFPETRDCPCDDVSADDTWRCTSPCNVIEVSEMPSGSVLTIDGRNRTANLRLAGGRTLPGLRYLSGAEGTTFQWLDLQHCSTVCFRVSVDCRVADDATVKIGHAARYLASG